MAVTLTPAQKKLFEDPNFGHLATLMADGSPQVTPVWVEIEGENILVNTAEGRIKPRNVRRDPRVAISIYNQANPYSAVWVRGRIIEVRAEGADEGIDRLAKKYLDQERYPWRAPDEQRLTLVIQPERVGAMMVD